MMLERFWQPMKPTRGITSMSLSRKLIFVITVFLRLKLHVYNKVILIYLS